MNVSVHQRSGLEQRAEGRLEQRAESLLRLRAIRRAALDMHILLVD